MALPSQKLLLFRKLLSTLLMEPVIFSAGRAILAYTITWVTHRTMMPPAIYRQPFSLLAVQATRARGDSTAPTAKAPWSRL